MCRPMINEVRSRTTALALAAALMVSLAPTPVQAQSSSDFSRSFSGVGAALVFLASTFGVSLNVTTMVPNGRRVSMSRRSVGWGIAGVTVGILSIAGAIPLALVDVGEERQVFSTGSAILMGCSGIAGIALGIADLQLPAARARPSTTVAPLVLASPSGASFGVTVVTTAF